MPRATERRLCNGRDDTHGPSATARTASQTDLAHPPQPLHRAHRALGGASTMSVRAYSVIDSNKRCALRGLRSKYAVSCKAWKSSNDIMTTERALLRVMTTGAWSSQTFSMVFASLARASEQLMLSMN